MEKKTVSVKAVLADIRSGMHDSELMRRHELTPSQLARLFTKLVDAGYLTAEEMEARNPKTTQACPFCHAEIPKNSARCSHCDQWLQARPTEQQESGSGGEQALPPPVPPIADIGSSRWEEKSCPWEDYATLGWWKAYIETLKGSLLNPTSFFSNLPTIGGLKEPLLYALISMSTVIVLSQLWSSLFGKGSSGFALGLGTFLLTVVLAPIGALVMIFIASGITHLCLSLVGGAHENFEATFRVVAYSQGTALLGVIPILGSLAGTIWNICIVTVGLREVHGATTGQAVAAILLPYVVCCGGAGLLIFFALTSGAFRM